MFSKASRKVEISKNYVLAGIAISIVFVLLVIPMQVQAASFNCAKAESKVEHLVCDNPLLSKLDTQLGLDYKDVLKKASVKQKQRVIVEQRRWLTHTRNVCESITCLKHAYWSRQAALQTYFEPRSPTYQIEQEKAKVIKQVLNTAPLRKLTHSDPKFCSQVLDDLKQMKDIRLVNPVVQTLSYEDPMLDPWKKKCWTAAPFNFSYQCERNILPANADDVINACKASYGLPPFKIYEIPSSETSSKMRHILYNDDAYGPMNRDHRQPSLGGGFVGFRQIHISKCLSVHGNYWEKGANEMSSWSKKSVSADAGRRDKNGKNYNSIFKYKNQYYFLVLHEKFGSYWLEVKPVESRRFTCSWAPAK